MLYLPSLHGLGDEVTMQNAALEFIVVIIPTGSKKKKQPSRKPVSMTPEGLPCVGRDEMLRSLI